MVDEEVPTSASGSDGSDASTRLLSSAAAAAVSGPQQQHHHHYDLVAVIPLIRKEGLVALCGRAYDFPALAALASEAAHSEQHLSLLATGCLLVQAVAVVRHWHMKAGPENHPRDHPREVKEYGQWLQISRGDRRTDGALDYHKQLTAWPLCLPTAP